MWCNVMLYWARQKYDPINIKLFDINLTCCYCNLCNRFQLFSAQRSEKEMGLQGPSGCVACAWVMADYHYVYNYTD